VGSGSDPASLQTRATEDGEDFLVNSQKIWAKHRARDGTITPLTDNQGAS